MTNKAWEDAWKIVFQQKTDEAEESQQEHCGEGEPDEIRPTRRTQAGDAASCWNRCGWSRGEWFKPKRTTQAERGNTACMYKMLCHWGNGGWSLLPAEE